MSDSTSDALFEKAIQNLSQEGHSQQAFDNFKKAAAQNHVKAQIFYAWFCLHNSAIRKDKSEDELSALDLEGVQTFEKTLDSEEAMNLLCKCYENSAKDSPEQLFAVSGNARLGFPYFYISRLYNQLNMPEKADYYLQQAAIQFQHPIAQNHYGFALYNQNKINEAINYIKLAAEQGVAIAHFNLGVFAESKQYADPQYNTDEYAAQCYEKAATLGYVEAMYVVGWIYQQGQGHDIDLKQAAYWYHQAALQGHLKAMNNYAFLLENNSLEPCDKKNAEDYYLLSAEGGYDVAQFNLALLLKKRGDQDEALKWFEIAGEGDPGHLDAQLQAARIYLEREHYAKAEYWLKKAIRQEDVGSMINLAILYENGDIDGQPNYIEAVMLYLMAVDYDHAEGEYGAALLYLSGKGVLKSREKAIQLLELAERHQHADAIALLAKLRSETLLNTPKPQAHPKLVIQSTPQRQHGNRTPTVAVSGKRKQSLRRRYSLASSSSSPIHTQRLRARSTIANDKPFKWERRILEKAIEDAKEFKDRWQKLVFKFKKSQGQSKKEFNDNIKVIREKIKKFMGKLEPEEDFFGIQLPDFKKSTAKHNEFIFGNLRLAYIHLYNLSEQSNKTHLTFTALDRLVMSFTTETQALLKQLDVLEAADFDQFIQSDCQKLYRIYSQVNQGLSSEKSFFKLASPASSLQFSSTTSEITFLDDCDNDELLDNYIKMKNAIQDINIKTSESKKIDYESMTTKIEEAANSFVDVAQKLLSIEESCSKQSEKRVRL